MMRRDQKGFVLVVTIWILATIAIFAAFLAERTSRSIALAQQRQEAAELKRVFASTRAEVIFRLGTLLITFEGLGAGPAIALDNRPYLGTGEDVVRLQDNRGLLNLNFFDSEMMFRLLGVLGVPGERRDAMMDALRDYSDDDDLKRLNGAESAEYRALDLPAPPNDFLATPFQLRNVIGWRDQDALWKSDRILQLVTTARVAGFNPNTAPPELLSSMPGSSPELVSAVLAARQVAPLRHRAQLPGTLSGIWLDSDHVLFAPSSSIRVTQTHPKLPWAEQYSITMTPRSTLAPWRIDYFTRTAVSYVIDNEAKIPVFPAAAPAMGRGPEAF